MKTRYNYDHYYKYDEITEVLSAWAKEAEGFFRMQSIGVTPKGRNIWMAELTDTSAGDFADKPGFALDGNVHAGEVTGSMACMYFIDVLLTNRDDPQIAELLKKYTVYCVPRIAVDGSEFYLTTPYTVRSSDRLFPFAEEQEGIQPEDLDGDGVIRRMRVKNPNGSFRISPDDPRRMIRRQPDETDGDFYDVFSEGILKGEPVEAMPAPERYQEDFNRNFPGWWGVGGRGGAYGLSAPETRAFASFLHEHRNICTCLNFHTHGGMYLYPPAFETRREASKEDMDRYKAIGKICTKETGYPFVNLRDEYIVSRPVGGSIDDFCHFVLGIVSFTCECWDIEARCGCPNEFPSKTEPDEERMIAMDAARLKWIDEENGGEGWKDWTVFEHPQLGTVEIGGIDNKHVIQNPPAKFLEQEIEKHTRFMLREMKLLPRLEVRSLKSKKLGGCYEVTAEVGNAGWLPTNVTAEAVKIGSLKPVRAELCGAEVIGETVIDIGQLAGYSHSGTLGSGRGGTTLNHAPQSRTLKYVVKAEAGTAVTLQVTSERAGCITKTLILGGEEEAA